MRSFWLVWHVWTQSCCFRSNTEGRELASAGWTLQSQALVWIAKNPVTLDDAARAEVEAFLEALDADDDVQNLYVGLS